MEELIRPIKQRHRVSFLGKLILQYAYRVPIGDCGSWDVIWRDAKFVELDLKSEQVLV